MVLKEEHEYIVEIERYKDIIIESLVQSPRESLYLTNRFSEEDFKNMFRYIEDRIEKDLSSFPSREIRIIFYLYLLYIREDFKERYQPIRESNFLPYYIYISIDLKKIDYPQSIKDSREKKMEYLRNNFEKVFTVYKIDWMYQSFAKKKANDKFKNGLSLRYRDGIIFYNSATYKISAGAFSICKSKEERKLMKETEIKLANIRKVFSYLSKMEKMYEPILNTTKKILRESANLPNQGYEVVDKEKEDGDLSQSDEE